MDRSFTGENNEEEEEKVIKLLRKSRKAFLIEYGCGIFLLVLLAAVYLKGIPLKPVVGRFVFGLALVALASGEMNRWFYYYKITNKKIVIIKGIIKQTKKNINYHPLAFVPEIGMKQGRIQRLLNYGTVFVESGGNSFEIRDVDSPKEVMELIESLIEKTRRK